jgi:YesN/AraC family two-component response regulator
MVIHSLQSVLEADGHLVTEAGGGREGIEAFRAAHGGNEPFDAVITDLGMPSVDGWHVAKAVKEVSPVTQVIMLTGWGQRLLAKGNVSPHVDQILSKPVTLRDLRDALSMTILSVNK